MLNKVLWMKGCGIVVDIPARLRHSGGLFMSHQRIKDSNVKPEQKLKNVLMPQSHKLFCTKIHHPPFTTSLSLNQDPENRN